LVPFLVLMLAGVPPALAEVAPGRVVFPIGLVGRHDGVDPIRMSVGVGRPDGGVVLAGLDPSRGVVLARLARDGSLDDSFGDRGIVRFSTPQDSVFPSGMPLQLLSLDDGRLIVVMAGPHTSKYELNQMLLVRLMPDGLLDPTFGVGGFAQPGVQASCGLCSPVSLLPDGDMVATGNTGQVPPAIEHDPSVVPRFRWVVARLSANGIPRADFGDQGTATLPGDNGMGFGTASLPGGSVAVVGRDRSGLKLARLLDDGHPDPAFHSGVPVAPPNESGFPMMRAAGDGSVHLLVVDVRPPDSPLQEARLMRYTAAGELDSAFGRGTVTVSNGDGPPELLTGPDGRDIVVAPLTGPRSVRFGSLQISRVRPDGVLGRVARVTIGFGGGYATFGRGGDPISPLRQSGFFPGRPFMRPDGSIVVPGAISVVQPTGEGAGHEVDRAAAVALTPSFALDASFGGPASPARLRARIPSQRVVTARRHHEIAVTTTTSGVGLCRLRVRAGRRLIADSTAPVFTAGRQTLRARTTEAAGRTLRHARHLDITVTATFRDLMGSTATTSAHGHLR
jgi:uncharacterized delta-60 repeat protein